MKENKINQLLDDKEFLIISHRGEWRGNIIQNTKEAVFLSKKAGADICEIDICRSKDGEYYLFHSGYENFILKKNVGFGDLTSSEIENAPTYSAYGSETTYRINRLDEFLQWLPEDYIINVDRAWFYFDDPKLYQIIEDSGKADQLFLKSRMTPGYHDYIDNLNEANSSLNFVAIIESQKEYEYIKSKENINLIGVELVAASETCDIFRDGFLQRLKDEGYLVVGNAEVLGVDSPFHYGLNDDVSLFEGYDAGWGKMLEDGVNALITHWTPYLVEYREQRKVK